MWAIGLQVLEAEALEGLLYAELQRTPKHGSQFSAAIRTILKRETQCAPHTAVVHQPKDVCVLEITADIIE